MKYIAYSFIVIFCLLNVSMAEAKKAKKVSPASFIRIDGQNLIAPGGEKFFIKGTNLGNWLNPEGYMFLFKKTSASINNQSRGMGVFLCVDIVRVSTD